MPPCKGRTLGISVAVAHGVFSGSLNILLKILISRYDFIFLTLVQCLTSSTAALTLEVLRRLGKIDMPPFSLSLAKVFASVTLLSTLQSCLTLWSLRGLSLPMYIVFKRCLPLVTLIIGVCLLKNGVPSIGVSAAVLLTTCGAALAGAGDLTGEPIGYVTGVLAVLVHAAYLVVIQKTSGEHAHGPLTAQYTIAVTASPILLLCSFASMDVIHVWSYPGWQDPAVGCTFASCILIGCLMNFTTLHCTYINSAVTTSFVGVVKSIATITVGMLAFKEVEPTSLFIAGVVVNTVGSVTYCAAKYFDTRQQAKYDDLEELIKGDEVVETASPAGAAQEFELQGDAETEPRENGSESTEAPGHQRDQLTENYVGVWRLLRHLRVFKKDLSAQDPQ
ncbi:solute carrier family 35 member D3 [Amblyraja radiata]|uniref:solute carrier family 35 member D3 n=1 Tax=Amblyraja radiata TaxID=386614 RepID=UPI0014029C43|nr:solute carrier family 35 member D3 [Amblyraja radiata]